MTPRELSAATGFSEEKIRNLLRTPERLPRRMEYQIRRALSEVRIKERKDAGIDYCEWRLNRSPPPMRDRAALRRHFEEVATHSCAKCEAVAEWHRSNPDPMADYELSPSEFVRLSLGAFRGWEGVLLLVVSIVVLAYFGAYLTPDLPGFSDSPHARQVGALMGMFGAILGFDVIGRLQAHHEDRLSAASIPRPDAGTGELAGLAQRELDRRSNDLRTAVLSFALIGVVVLGLAPPGWDQSLTLRGVGIPVAIGLTALGLLDLWRQRAVQAWPKVRGNVVGTSVLIEDRKTGRSAPAVFTEYDVGGSTFRGWRVHTRGPYGTHGEAQDICDGYDVGSEIDISIHPRDPSRSVIDRSIKKGIFMTLSLIATLLAALALTLG